MGKDGVEINTVEHILAAISGTEIDYIIIEIDNIEVPIMDGSSREFIEKISEIGTKEQSSEKRFFEISKRIEHTDEQSGTEYIALPKSDFSVEVEIFELDLFVLDSFLILPNNSSKFTSS